MAQATRTPGPGTTIKDALAATLITSAAHAADVAVAWVQVDRPSSVVVVTTLGAISSDVSATDIEIVGADDSSGTNTVSDGHFDAIGPSDDSETRYLEAVVHKPYMGAILDLTRSGSGTVVAGVKVHAIEHLARSNTRTA